MPRGSVFFDGPAAGTFPPVPRTVRFLLLANVGVFLLEVVSTLVSPRTEGLFIRTFGLVPGDVLRFPPFLWQLVTYGFVHSPHDLTHVLVNMLALYMLGGLVEERKGSAWFRRLYGVSLLAGALAHVVYGTLRFEGRAPCIGASGAVLGVVLAAARLYPRQPVFFWFVPLPLWLAATILVAFDVFPILDEIRPGAPLGGVAHAAHLGGALAGFLWAGAPSSLAQRSLLPSGTVRALRRFLETRRRRAEEERRRRMDALLGRISREGIGGLSSSERRFLRRESARARARRGGRA
ncbi:MAG TPA: rhomboid family intramembrane serine protease [Planctomycetota bacterium]|jgi:membrane associated rhomboid family serine protease|nr:rhomboid family intramembrane serine protease [Planctomycetota bacterium]